MMDLQDRIVEFVLPIVDWAINFVTFGAWSRWQGTRAANYEIKE